MKVLLVVDLQKQFRSLGTEYNCVLNELKRIEKDYDKVIATVFSQTANGEVNENFYDKLHWLGCKNCSEKDLEFDTTNKTIIIKNSYGIKNIEKYFSKDDEIDIIGCDSDACIMAVCFQLFDLGYNFNVLSKFIYTTSSSYPNKMIIKSLIRNFGDCIK